MQWVCVSWLLEVFPMTEKNTHTLTMLPLTSWDCPRKDLGPWVSKGKTLHIVLIRPFTFNQPDLFWDVNTLELAIKTMACHVSDFLQQMQGFRLGGSDIATISLPTSHGKDDYVYEVYARKNKYKVVPRIWWLLMVSDGSFYIILIIFEWPLLWCVSTGARCSQWHSCTFGVSHKISQSSCFPVRLGPVHWRSSFLHLP